MTIDLGKVAITAGGSWNANTSYEALTLVVYDAETGGDGCGYISLKNNLGVAPGTDESVWKKAAEAGQSIYQLAVKYGTFVGTEQEFVEAYNAAVQAATSAASSANTAATYARETADAAATYAREAADAAAAQAVADAAAAGSAAQATANAAADEAREVKDAMLVQMDTYAELEETREENEQSRQDNEQDRQSAEASRASAETAREDASAEAVAAANAAAENAEQKAAAANTAAAAASSAAEDATEAAEAARQMNAGLMGLVVEDGQLFLVQDAETGTVESATINDDGMVEIEFSV